MQRGYQEDCAPSCNKIQLVKKKLYIKTNDKVQTGEFKKKGKGGGGGAGMIYYRIFLAKM